MHRLLSAVALCLGSVGIAPAQALPPDLAAVPANAIGFVSINVPEFLASPLGDEIKLALSGLKPGEWAAFERKFVPSISSVQRLTIVIPDQAAMRNPFPEFEPLDRSALIFVGCKEPFAASELLAGAFSNARQKEYKGRLYALADDDWRGIMPLPGNRAFVFGAEDSLIDYIDSVDKIRVGPLADLRAESLNFTVTVAVNPSAAVANLPPLPAPFDKLAVAKFGRLGLKLTQTLDADLQMEFTDATAAKRGEEALKAAISLGRAAIAQGLAEAQKLADPPEDLGRKIALSEMFPRLGGLIGVSSSRLADESLAKLKPEVSGNKAQVGLTGLRISGSGSLYLTLVFAISMSLGKAANVTFAEVGDAIRFGQPEMDTREMRLAKAFEAYHQKNGHYPGPAILSEDGKPLLSWRVALLPYLGQEELYKEFKLDEPWDSLHNKKLISKLSNRANVFKFNWRGTGRVEDQLLIAPGALFDGNAKPSKAGLTQPRETILFASFSTYEVKSPHWTRPRDISIQPGEWPAAFGKFDFSTVNIVFVDGKTKLLKRENLRELTDLLKKK